MIRALRTNGLVTLGTLVATAAVWELVARSGSFRFLPPLTVVIARLREMISEQALLGDLWLTIGNIAMGMAIAVATGVTVGLLVGTSYVAKNTLGYLVETFQSAPASALVPVIVVLLGFGRQAMITIVVIFAFFIIAISTAAGVGTIPRSLHDLARTVGGSRSLVLRKVIIPGASPMILTGLKLAVGRAVNGAILAEILITIRGLGGRMMFYGGSFDFVSLYALLVVVLAMTYVLMGLVQAVTNRLTRWQ